MFACLNSIQDKNYTMVTQYTDFHQWDFSEWSDVKGSGSENRKRSFGYSFGAHARVDVAMSETGENLSKRYKIYVLKRY